MLGNVIDDNEATDHSTYSSNKINTMFAGVTFTVVNGKTYINW